MADKKSKCDKKNSPRQPALMLENQAYALISVNTSKSTQLWKARLLPDQPDSERFYTIKPNEEGHNHLLDLGRKGEEYPDPERGELVGVKISKTGDENIRSLETEYRALKRLGDSALPMHYPLKRELWAQDFPCITVAWPAGKPLSEMGAFSEKEGLRIAHQLAGFLVTIRMLAPDIIPTDTFNAENIYIHKDEEDNYDVQIFSWDIYVEQERVFKERTLLRFGEVLLNIFTPGMKIEFDRHGKTVLIEHLGKGKTEDTGIEQWDTISWGTRNIIRRCLMRDFEGDASEIVRSLRDAIGEQLTIWGTDDLLQQAYQQDGPERLNCWDISSLKGDAPSENDYKRLWHQVLHSWGKQGKHIRAITDLYIALRRFCQDSTFRWSMLAHAIAQRSKLPKSYTRLRLAETISAMVDQEYTLAKVLLESRQKQWPTLKDSQTNEVLGWIKAIHHRIEILRTTIPAKIALEEDWHIEEAEKALQVAEKLNAEADQLEEALLLGDDPFCVTAIDQLQQTVSSFYQKFSDYDSITEDTVHLSAIRQGRFDLIIERARQLSKLAQQKEMTDLAVEALKRYDIAWQLYPKVWEQNASKLEDERKTIQRFLTGDWLKKAQKAFVKGESHRTVYLLNNILQIDLEENQALEMLSFLQKFQRAVHASKTEQYDQAVRDFEYLAQLAWPEAQDLIDGWLQTARVGKKLHKAEQLQSLWTESAPHAAEIIALSVSAFDQMQRWQQTEKLGALTKSWQERAVTFWQAALQVLTQRINEAIEYANEDSRLYYRFSYRQLVKTAQTALEEVISIQAEDQSPKNELIEKLDSAWRKAQAIYAYAKASALIEERDYESALAAVRRGDDAKSNHPLVTAHREEVAQLIVLHMQPYWEELYSQSFESGKISSVLASTFARLIDPSQEDTLAPLAELGNHLLEPGVEGMGVKAIHLLLSEFSEDGRIAFGRRLAAFRPDDCRIWFYHFSCVVRLIREGRYTDALGLTKQAKLIQQSAPDIEEQIEQVACAIQAALGAIWKQTYQQFSDDGSIASSVQRRLEYEGIHADLIKLANEHLDSRQDHAVLAEKLSRDAMAGDRQSQFAEQIAKLRPAEYASLLKEWNRIMAALTEKHLRDAKLAIYARSDADEKIHFNLRYTLGYFFSRERIAESRQGIRAARRFTPTSEFRRHVKYVRGTAWLITSLTLIILIICVTVLWNWLNP